jgi:hypothetical protein
MPPLVRPGQTLDYDPFLRTLATFTFVDAFLAGAFASSESLPGAGIIKPLTGPYAR